LTLNLRLMDNVPMKTRAILISIAAGVLSGAVVVTVAFFLARQPHEFVQIEAKLASGSTISFSFPALHPRFPIFEQPVSHPEVCGRISTVRISISRSSERDQGEFTWNDYEVLEAASGPFVRRIHPPLNLPPPYAGVPEIGGSTDWCGIPHGLSSLETKDDTRIVRETIALLASICDRPDLPFQME